MRDIAASAPVYAPWGSRWETASHKKAAGELGLSPGTPVGVSIIDAHTGGVGLLGMTVDGAAPSPDDFERRLALIGGTSTCHMAVSGEPRFIPGIWGPLLQRYDTGGCGSPRGGTERHRIAHRSCHLLPQRLGPAFRGGAKNRDDGIMSC